MGRSLWLLIGVAVLFGGCSCEPEAHVERQSKIERKDAPRIDLGQFEKKTGPPVFVVEIVDLQRDSFPRSLGNLEVEFPEPAFSIRHGLVHLADELREEMDTAAVAERNLVLPAGGVPLAECKLLVLHTTQFDGVGRTLAVQRFYGFKDLRATVKLSGSELPEAFHFDPAQAGPGFGPATYRFQVLPPGLDELRIAIDENGSSATVTTEAGETKLKPRTEYLQGEGSHTIHITRKALVADPIEPQAGEANLTIVPAEDFGPIELKSEVSVIFHGAYPTALD